MKSDPFMRICQLKVFITLGSGPRLWRKPRLGLTWNLIQVITFSLSITFMAWIKLSLYSLESSFLLSTPLVFIFSTHWLCVSVCIHTYTLIHTPMFVDTLVCLRLPLPWALRYRQKFIILIMLPLLLLGEQLKLTVTPDDYMDKLVEYGIMKIFAICHVDQTKQSWSEEDDFQVIKPVMNLEVKFTNWLILAQLLN